MLCPLPPPTPILAVQRVDGRNIPWFVVGTSMDRVTDPIALGLPPGTRLTDEDREKAAVDMLANTTGATMCYAIASYTAPGICKRRYVFLQSSS